jgi:hypothetical protein
VLLIGVSQWLLLFGVDIASSGVLIVAVAVLIVVVAVAVIALKLLIVVSVVKVTTSHINAVDLAQSACTPQQKNNYPFLNVKLLVAMILNVKYGNLSPVVVAFIAVKRQVCIVVRRPKRSPYM